MALSTIEIPGGSAAWTISRWAGSAVVGELVNTGFSYLRDCKLPTDSEAELKRLQTALPEITEVMGIVEALKMKDPSVSSWVDQFRQAFEASEDVLDELEYNKMEEMVRNRDEAGGSTSSSKKREPCTIKDDTLKRLKEAVTMLDRAAAETECLLRLAKRLGIHDLSESWQEDCKVLSHYTTSFLAERVLIGREVEKDKIIGWLKQPTNARLSSFGIVGVGGIGKTTLVQFAYRELHRSINFDKTIWVCVSTNFNVEDITRKMLGELGENSRSGEPLNALQETLKEKIHLKKILLILDDIRDDDEKGSNWEQLIAPLRFVQQGSKILFTTRMKSVADLLASVISMEHESLALQGLGEQDLRLLFYSYAFGSNPDNHKDLQIFGDQILKMLSGSPLAAKVIGSLLNSRVDHQYWRRILNQGNLFKLEEAKDVMEVLKLSYFHLPADLQVCFRFCSIFPQDHKFDKEELIKMWIVSGFIRQQSSQKERLEDIGEYYFNLLLRKSFFELAQNSFEDIGEGEVYVMHDLMRELAQNISYGECCTIESNNNSFTIPSTIRHVFVHDSEIDRVSHLWNLRSLVIFGSRWNPFVLPNNLMKKPLRLLKIKVYRTFELPEEISCLVHLRYLSIELDNYLGQSFKFSLLASISTLYHLQVLKFPTIHNYSNLEIETTGMTNLLGLWCMSLPQEIMQTIHGVHKLTSLQELTFFVGQESGHRINELGTLNNLKHLIIEKIENIGDPAEAKSANLLQKNNLMSLSLKWTSNSNPHNPEEIIDDLQPHTNLMKLKIENFKGQRSPSWMVDLPSLKILDIYDCLNLDELPIMPLSLIKFRISNVGLTSLPNLYQSSNNDTTAPISQKSYLREVKIENCPNLISLNGFLQQDYIDLQAIEVLTIGNCYRLVHLPTHELGKLTSLKYLTLKNNPKLVATDFQGNLLPAKLQQLKMGNCGELDFPLLEASSGATTLTELKLENANIISITATQNSFRSLKGLNIWGCTMLVEISFQEEAHGINQGNNFNILELDIRNCPNLIKFSGLLPLSLTKFCISNVGLSALPEYNPSSNSSSGSSTSSLNIVDINNCQNLTSLNGFLQHDNIDFQSIKEITVIRCKYLVNLPMGAFGKFVSLRRLFICDCPMLMAIDNQSTFLPMALKYLSIDNCGKLDEPLLESASSLPTLTDLFIKNCANISRIPSSENAFRSLNMLSIWGCKKLVEHPSREQAQGVDQWSRLASLKINHLEIDNLSLLLVEPLRSLRFVSNLFVDEYSGKEALLEQWLLQNSSTLTKLTLRDVRTLNSLPAMRLTVLQDLRMWRANLLEELPDLPVSLRSLSIYNAHSLKSLPATMVRLTALTRLMMQQVDLLEELPELPTCLRDLIIYSASSLKSLPATMARLTALEKLKISNAKSLKELPELPASLKQKKIQGCGGRCL